MCASTNDEKMEKEKRLIDNRLVLNKKTLNAHGAQEVEISLYYGLQNRSAHSRGSSLECTRTDAKVDNGS